MSEFSKKLASIDRKIPKRNYPAITGWRSYTSLFTTVDYEFTILNFKEYLIKNVNIAKSQDPLEYHQTGCTLMQSRSIRSIVEYVDLSFSKVPKQLIPVSFMVPKYPRHKQEFDNWIKRLEFASSCLTLELANNLKEYDKVYDQLQTELKSNFIPSSEFDIWNHEQAFSGD